MDQTQDTPLWVDALIASGVAGVVLALLLSGALEVHRVYSDVLMTGWREGNSYLIPYRSIELGSVRVYRRSMAIRRKYPETSLGATRANVSHHYAVTFVCTAQGGGGSVVATSVTGWQERWILTTQHPRRFLAALEEAMVGKGIAKARGLADLPFHSLKDHDDWRDKHYEAS
ncbi:hypothetical protein LWF01_02370 [Saxibacter everestensis]|uniref:PH domain-containing protein n=1 Tax=Saxibacter everestensis TaxID=2909229 RepID=A0ABY8QUD0_9MICO|nr:hypothetical protein LWF01_02370 [Brevibacteriaceae bacterium ZFBP1038]